MARLNGRNRKHSKIDRLPVNLKDTVEQMLLTGATYQDVVEYLGEYGVPISTSSVHRYADGFHANLQKIHMSRENFRMMVEEFERYPDVDYTQAIEALACHNVVELLANMPKEKWQEVSADRALREASAIIRAVGYKKRIDMQNQSDQEAGYDAVKDMAFTSMAKEDPELYNRVSAFVSQQKKKVREEGVP